MNNDEFQGWRNRETWAVGNHTNNDKGFFLYLYGVYKRMVQVESETADKYFTDWLASHFDELKDMPFNEHRDENVLRMLLDIGSLWRVDWDEVAKHLIGRFRA